MGFGVREKNESVKNEPGTETHGQTGRQTDRQTDRPRLIVDRCRQAGKYAGRQADRHGESGREIRDRRGPDGER